MALVVTNGTYYIATKWNHGSGNIENSRRGKDSTVKFIT